MPSGVPLVYLTLMNPLTTFDASSAELLTVCEVAMMCHCSDPRIRPRIADGSLRAVKLGKPRSCAIRIPCSALDEWLHR
jgi:excisionase family DNA binding protein